jgi:hypothetical protein
MRDAIAPRIMDSVGDLHLKVSDDDASLLQGLTATDDKDGDLTDRILVERMSRFSKPGVCEVSYVVFDNSNNFVRYQRTVTYDDYVSPRLQFDRPLLYNMGEQITITDRIKLYDCLDGDISHTLKLETSNVPDDTDGIYEIEIKATSNYGDEVYARVPLNIEVNSGDAPKIELKQYLAYAKVGEFFEASDYIESVSDREGNSIPVSAVKVISQVDLSKSGGGQIRFEVTDQRGVKGITYLTVIVEEA